MDNFIRHFLRLEPGVWTCVKSADLNMPGGRIQVAIGSIFKMGIYFMGVDLARNLEDEYQKHNGAGPPAA
jgi:hypothetical protein